ncbi:glycosyltransferase family 2 protein [Desertivirga xinjiangensis]|uniref:glycosyltransferase family 2 protein n=1 Tax=Desertivirga xinjiangensis TaxID=539206 RepID=UPI0021088141|nr:glycosyltransferase family 2 protein [Pedobacter xinjiangensis]
MINIVIPLAASKLDDDNENFLYPLPLVDIQGRALIEYLLENLNKIDDEKRFIFVLKQSDCKRFHLDNTLRQLVNSSTFIRINGQTKGAVCSILLSIDNIEKSDELIIVNSDQVIDVDYNIVLNKFRTVNADGGLITFPSVHPRWSFVRLDNHVVVETAEKNPISNKAIAGFYYFKKAIDFIEGAFDVIKFDDNVLGNYYTSSVYNQMILNGKKIETFEIPKDAYHSFYSPQKIKEFEEFLKLTHGKV